MASIFSKIASRDIPGQFVAEDDNFFAILDINPLSKGHVLVIPKMEVDYIYDLPDTVLSDYFLFSKRVAKAIEASVSCERVGVAVVGLEVPHAHIHLIPINSVSDMDFGRPKLQLTNDELAALAATIAGNFT